MKRWLVLLAAALLIGSVKVVYTAQVFDMPSRNGVIALLDASKEVQICTAVVVHKNKAPAALEYLALTAKHCVTGGVPAMAKLMAGDPRTLKWIGDIRVLHRYTDRDLALFAFTNERDLPNTWGIAEISPRLPVPGEVIWGAGIVYWGVQTPQLILISSGVWTDTPAPDRGEMTYMAMLPVTSGQSGGPVFVDGKVFGLMTAGYHPGPAPDGNILSPWTGITLIGEVGVNE